MRPAFSDSTGRDLGRELLSPPSSSDREFRLLKEAAASSGTLSALWKLVAPDGSHVKIDLSQAWRGDGTLRHHQVWRPWGFSCEEWECEYIGAVGFGSAIRTRGELLAVLKMSWERSRAC